jgi:hypothetical protein
LLQDRLLSAKQQKCEDLKQHGREHNPVGVGNIELHDRELHARHTERQRMKLTIACGTWGKQQEQLPLRVPAGTAPESEGGER